MDIFSIYNHQIDWDEIAHIATMAYTIFPHSSAGEVPFYLIFECDPFMPTLFKLLLLKLRYMGDAKCRIHLDAMREICMMAVLNLKMARDKCPSQIRDPDKTDFKLRDMVLIKNHTPKDTFDLKYKPSFRNCKKILDKAFDVYDSVGRVR